MRTTRLAALAATAIGITAISAGCGSSSSSSTTAPSGSTSSQSASAGAIAVSLTEMKVTADPASATAGSVTFDVTNSGKIPHEMVVIKTDKQADQLGAGSRVPETGSQGETGGVPAGGTKKLTLKLAAGHYALVCNIAGHYAAGMHTDFTVN